MANTNTDPFDMRRRDPLPNILRIETLSQKAMREYTSAWADIGVDAQHQLRSTSKLAESSKMIFYGFMQNESISVDFNPQWSGGDTNNVLEASKKLVSATPGGDSFGGRIKNSIAGVVNLATSDLAKKATRFVGANASLTGQSTQQYLNGFSMSAPNIQCGWYLPQSFKQAIIGLKTITEMACPQSILDEQKIVDGLGNAVASGIDGATDMIGMAVTGSKAIISSIKDQDLETQKQFQKLAQDGQAVVRNLATSAEDLLGITITHDPLPLRVSIGNKAVLEPMIITSISIRMSKESFLKTYSDGTQKLLPEFVLVNIAFDYWMTPSPLKNKMKLLGFPMFSTSDGVTRRRATLDGSEFTNVFKD